MSQLFHNILKGDHTLMEAAILCSAAAPLCVPDDQLITLHSCLLCLRGHLILTAHRSNAGVEHALNTCGARQYRSHTENGEHARHSALLFDCAACMTSGAKTADHTSADVHQIGQLQQCGW